MTNSGCIYRIFLKKHKGLFLYFIAGLAFTQTSCELFQPGGDAQDENDAESGIEELSGEIPQDESEGGAVVDPSEDPQDPGVGEEDGADGEDGSDVGDGDGADDGGSGGDTGGGGGDDDGSDDDGSDDDGNDDNENIPVVNGCESNVVVEIVANSHRVQSLTPRVNKEPVFSQQSNPNLFVSAQNAETGNRFSGPQVIEVRIEDSEIGATNEAYTEPNVTVNGNVLRMAQAVDGNWYAYFADRDQAQKADQTVVDAGVQSSGLDFGVFCKNDTQGIVLGTDFSGAAGVAVAREGNMAAFTHGEVALSTCTGGFDKTTLLNSVVREAKDLNAGSTSPLIPPGQIGIDVNAWPIVQLYDLPANFVVSYEKGSTIQSVDLSYGSVTDLALVELDRVLYPKDAEVHLKVSDWALNIDPTDEDSWTFGTKDGVLSANYQVFDEAGSRDGDAVDGGTINLFNYLSDLMFGSSGVLTVEGSTQNELVMTLQDNGISENILKPGSDPEQAENYSTIGGFLDVVGALEVGTQPVTIVEQGHNSRVFSSTDPTGVSNLKITRSADGATAVVISASTASVEYNNLPTMLLVRNHCAAWNIGLPATSVMGGQSVDLQLSDEDLNKNSMVKEELNVFRSLTSSIPATTIGTPFTLKSLASASLGASALDVEVETASQRALLKTQAEVFLAVPDNPFFGTSTLVLNLGATFGELNQVIRKTNFRGFNFFNYDFRALSSTPGRKLSDASAISASPTITVRLTDGRLMAVLLDGVTAGKGLMNLAAASGDDIFSMNRVEKVRIEVEIQVPSEPDKLFFYERGTVLPIVADFFSFGIIGNGNGDEAKINNMISRFELNESNENTGKFVGTITPVVLNQLSFLKEATYLGLPVIDENAQVIVFGKKGGTEHLSVAYPDLGINGNTANLSADFDFSTNDASLALDKAGYYVGQIVVVTLNDKDLDMNPI